VKRFAPVPPIVGAILFSAVLGATPAPLSGQAGREEVASLRFEGNRAVRTADLELAILTRPTRCQSAALLPFCWLGAGFAKDEYFRSPRQFPLDMARIQVFYYQRGYRETAVDTVVTPAGDGRVDVTFVIDERRPVVIDSLGFEGLGELPPALAVQLPRDLPVRRGDPLNLLALDAARSVMEGRLREAGYAHADILLRRFVPSGSYDAEVVFDIYPGVLARFGAVTVEGNERVDETVIRRMLPFREGSRYRREAIFEGQRNLFGLEILRQADIQQDLEHRPDSLVPVHVRVAEGNQHRVRTGVGWSTADCLSTEARWSSRNFLGGARRLQLRGRVAGLLTDTFRDPLCPQAGTGDYGRTNWLASVDFNQPFIFSARNALSAGIYAERQSLQDVFVREALGLNLALSRSIGRGAFMTASYRPQLGRLGASEIFFCTSYLVCDPGDIDALQSTNTLSPVGLGVSRDRVNQPLNPSSGHRVLLELEHASGLTGSDFAFNRAIAEAAIYRDLGGTVLAARLRGGWLVARPFGGGLGSGVTDREIAHPQKRFYAGGANSVRGFAQNQLGPRILTVDVRSLVEPGEGDDAPCSPLAVVEGSCDAGPLPDGEFQPRPAGGSTLLEGGVEARFPLFRSLVQGAAFVDFGQVFAENVDLQIGGVEWTPGLGVRYLSPIGPLRLDVAYRTVGGEDLRVITSALRPLEPGEDPSTVRTVLDDEWVILDRLVPLTPAVRYGESAPWSWQRFQIHLSIGQAF
jgi:outer membrane protein insertion porin family